ncbi:MAG: tetratricopeptide repeat protein, partial [Pseudomonadota bacterium]|nr:tetratricopeptide repeat protein [Pseudomonadota bacterium]
MTETTTTLRAQLLQLRAAHRAGTLDAATYQTARAPLERRWLDAALDEPMGSPSAAVPPIAVRAKVSTPVWAGAVAFVVLVAGAGYLWKGVPGAIGQAPAGFTEGAPPIAAAASAPPNVTREQVESMVARLAAKLQAEPDDADGWVMLGRSYMALDRPADATGAYQHAIKLRPKDAGLLADAADAIAAGSPTGLAGEPMQMIDRALALEPDNLKALALAGSAAFNRGDYAGA